MQVRKKHLGITVVLVGILCGLGLVLLNNVSAPDTTNTTPEANDTLLHGEAGDTGVTGGHVDASDEHNTAFNTDNMPIKHLAFPADAAPKSVLHFPKVNFARQRISTAESSAQVIINNAVYPLRAYKALLTPNDPNASQWWTSATSLPTAWDTSTGSSNVTIAIIDTGFALNHEEFAGRWHQNAGETGTATRENASILNCTDRGLNVQANCNLVDDNLDGLVDNESGAASYQNPSKLNCGAQNRGLTKDCNNVDDDNNGFTDDVTGWDFMNQDNSVQAGQLNAAGEGTTHGTMVAGVAAATGNNGKGIAGVNWHAKILPIQALDDDGYGDSVSVGQAIYYAVSQNVHVISISLGTAYNDPFVQEAIEAATAAGITVVAASGNDGCNCITYPARYPEVFAVGALDSSGAPANFSSYGNELDVLAPGVSIRTTTWTSANQSGAYVSGVAGTSFATPYVAGLVASMKSVRPTANPLQLIGAVNESANNPAAMTTRPLDSRYGYGVVSASASLQRMSIPKTGLQVYRFTPVQVGRYLTLGVAYEFGSNYSVHYCENELGTTPIYQLTKGSSVFYTISKIEMQKATSAGYTVSRFTYACIQQDHDSYSLARLIDIFKEFRNDYSIR